jgi:hypothetical protein
MAFRRAQQRVRGCRRIQQQGYELLLRFPRKPDDFDLSNRLPGSLLGCCNSEIADGAALNLGSAALSGSRSIPRVC